MSAAPFLDPDPNPRPAKAFTPPPGSCDCHAHVIGPHARYPLVNAREGVVAPEAVLGEYRHMLDTLGIERCVLVQPGVYGTDNTLVLDAIAEAPDRFRGIAVVEETIADAELVRIRTAGVRGIRFNTRGSGPRSAGKGRLVTVETVQQMGDKLARAGLHAQLLVVIENFPDIDRQLADLPVDVVIDHLGYPDPRLGLDAPGFRMLLRWLETGRCWVKLSAPYRFTAEDVPYAAVTPLVWQLVAAAPERMLWATDWPHSAAFLPSDPRRMPNDGALLDLLADWVPDAAVRKRILVDNPATLYGFA